ncbi:hypothetical protein [Streptoalloteichus tenebrarius]|nr:hypothetical protein [Streptoalloteichus tenebrarius]BFE99522.1 hypothetical protein GCM10020241_11980 [Streptoalloteichus tenebrarius]
MTEGATTGREELTPAQEEELVARMLRHQVSIEPDHCGAVLDLAAVGLVNSAWRNSPVEDWHAGDGPLSDGDMLRINSHTTSRVRDMVRRWRTDCGIDAHAPVAYLDELDIEAIDWLAGKLCRWLTDPRRRLPTGIALADLAGDNLGEYTDHAWGVLGGVAQLAEDRSTHYAFWRAAAHAGLACRHWWGTPTWPGLVDRFVGALDDPTDPHWGPEGQWFSRLPGRPREIADNNRLRRALLQNPWKLGSESAEFLVSAGIGMMRDSIPPMPATDSTH